MNKEEIKASVNDGVLTIDIPKVKACEKQPAVKQIEITVNSGDGSLTVAKKLEQAGLIQDAKEFDRYLCQNGYDKKICTGVHTFEEGASDEEIAKEITRKAK